MEPTYPIAPPPQPPPEEHHERMSTTQFHPTQALTDRILRALGHRLFLLHRSDPNFYILGATGNVYIVNVSTTPACTCPDRATPCKHILFVLIKVLGVPLDDPCLRKRTLRPNQLTRLLANPSSIYSLAGPSLRERFHRAFARGSTEPSSLEGSLVGQCTPHALALRRVLCVRFASRRWGRRGRDWWLVEHVGTLCMNSA